MEGEERMSTTDIASQGESQSQADEPRLDDEREQLNEERSEQLDQHDERARAADAEPDRLAESREKWNEAGARRRSGTKQARDVEVAPSPVGASVNFALPQPLAGNFSGCNETGLRPVVFRARTLDDLGHALVRSSGDGVELPELPLTEWEATKVTLHLWTQVVDKVQSQ